jgi:hypothetical protein
MDQFMQIIEGTNVQAPDYSLESTLLSLLLAFVLGQLVAWSYTWTHSGLSYSRSFTQSLVLITMLVCLVMFVIGNSIIAAFGLLGALAIIRFRNVLKDTRDTVFIFLVLVLGMACGTQRYLTAIVGTVCLLLVMAYLWWTGFGGNTRYDGYLTLRITAPADADVFPGTMQRFCRRLKRVSERQAGGQDGIEYLYQVGLRDRTRAQDLVEALRRTRGVSDASLVLHDELAEV